MEPLIKKGLFYCRVNRDDIANVGVIKKCLGQVDGFRMLGFNMDIVWLCNDGILLNEKLIYNFRKPLKPHLLSMYLFYYFRLHAILKRNLPWKEYSFVYARYELSHPALISFFKAIKQYNPDAKILVEIPTYPYHSEMKGALRRFQLLIDKVYRRNLKSYINYISVIGMQNAVFGIPSINLQNGIDLTNIPLAKTSPFNKHIRLIAIGYWSYWQGLERLIEGLKNYFLQGKPEIEVSLHIIGEGRNLDTLKARVDKYKLHNKVRFSPPLTGIELSKAFDNAQMGVGDLASFRKGLKEAQPLKHREYAGRGCPFFYATDDPGFEMLNYGILKIPANEQPVDVQQIVAFALSLPKDCSTNLRNHVASTLNWKDVLRPIYNHLLHELIVPSSKTLQ